MKKIKLILINLFFLTLIILSIIFGDKEADYYSYAIGLLSGIWAVLIVTTINSFSKKKKMKQVFDERQLLNRGKCYEIAFQTLAFLLILDGFIRIMFNFNWSTYLVGTISMLLTSSTVFAIKAIQMDAYHSINSNKKQIIITSIGFGLFNLVFGVIKIIDGTIIENNMVSNYFLNLIAGLMPLMIAGVLLVKKDQESIDSYEES